MRELRDLLDQCSARLTARGLVPQRCTRPPEGWGCSLETGHEGPCPTRPVTHVTTLLTRIQSVFCKHRWRFIGPDKHLDRFECMKCFKKVSVSVVEELKGDMDA